MSNGGPLGFGILPGDPEPPSAPKQLEAALNDAETALHNLADARATLDTVRADIQGSSLSTHQARSARRLAEQIDKVLASIQTETDAIENLNQESVDFLERMD